MDRAFALILYSLAYRLAIIGTGTLFVTLGSKLFSKDADRIKNTVFEGNVGGRKAR
jgi:hypothetical protein